jgi:hypothetical protein
MIHKDKENDSWAETYLLYKGQISENWQRHSMK